MRLRARNWGQTTALAGVLAAATFGGFGAGEAQAQGVVDQTLSSVQVDRAGACTLLTVKFNVRVQLLSYFPKESGQDLHIRVQPIDPNDFSRLRETLRTPDSVPALRGIEYEGDNPSGPVLSLYFSKNQRFEVVAGDTPEQILIRLADPGVSCDAVPTAPEPTATPTPDASPGGLYVVNALSVPSDLPELSAEQKAAIAGRVAYDTQTETDGAQWHRLRVGFFESKEQADAFAAQIGGAFPGAWTIRVTPEERAEGLAKRIDTGPLLAEARTGPAIEATAEQSAEVDRLIADAETAIAGGEIDRAIQLLTNARALPEAAASPRAQELLALTRERKGQIAQAQGEYEAYLARYPSGEGSDRVRQRLAALGGAPAPSGGTLREASAPGSPADWAWDVRGSFSQFYFRDQSRTQTIDASKPVNDPEIRRVNLNELLTAADVTVTGGNDRTQVTMRAAGSYGWNFVPGQENVKALTALYVDYTDLDVGFTARVGRQTRNSGGVFGRFDGMWTSWQAKDNIRLNAIIGFPVQSSRQLEFMDDRPFYGFSVDFGARNAPFQTTLYWYDQRAKGNFIDRQAVGIEARYLKGRFNSFALLDYDVKHSDVNLALLTLNYNFPDTSSLSATADYRKQPLLTTHNALLGMTTVPDFQPIFELSELRRYFTDAEIYQLARDRTQATKTLTMAYSRPITKKLQANFDLSMTSTSGTPLVPATTGTNEIAPVADTGTEFYYGTQLIGTGLFWSNDIYILSGRYADTQRSNVYTVDFNARIPVSDKLRVSPRLRYGWRNNKFDDERYREFQPTLRVNYYPVKFGEFELEAGVNFARNRVTQAGVLQTTNQTNFIVTAGYRLDF